MSSALTVKSNGGILKVIKSEVGVSVPFIEGDPAPEIKKFVATWDTGASCTVITKKVVDELGLKPIDITQATSASTTEEVKVYLVNVQLPSNVTVTNVRVIEMNVTQSDMLIGMDILTLGDFSITNHQGVTCMSFRIPSSHEIDYVKDVARSKLPRHERRKQEREEVKRQKRQTV